MRIGAHESTTAQLGALYPFVASEPLPGGGIVVGRDLSGSLFVHDPFELYRQGVLTNPNMIVLGQIGRGKSAFVKTYLYRHAAFGRRIVVLDPKGEYDALARALGTVSIRLEPGGSIRLNPLDVAPRTSRGAVSLDSDELLRRRLQVLVAVAGACLGRLLGPIEHTALELALSDLSNEKTPLLGDVVASLLEPSQGSAERIGASVETLRHDGRDVALELRRLIVGELRGIFDGPTSPGIDLFGPAVILDMAALYDSPALGAVISCAQAALEGSWREPSRQTILVVDEAWAVLACLPAARFLQSSFKLARAHGVANLAVVHRLSDLAASGEQGSVTERLAEGLLADCETVVCYAQPDAELPALSSTLGVDEAVARTIARLRRGVAYWRVGRRSFLVEHRLAKRERALVDTDAALIGQAR